MESEAFLAACATAQEIVSQLPNETYRAAAFQVALDRLLSDTTGTARAGVNHTPTKSAHADAPRVTSDTQKRILDLRNGGFFGEPRLPAAVQNELRTLGFHHNPGDVRMALLRMAQKKLLRRIQESGNKYRYASI
jgi:hypothetical protein